MFASPGVAIMMVKENNDGLVLNIITSCWSIFVVAILMAIVAGIIIWMLVRVIIILNFFLVIIFLLGDNREMDDEILNLKFFTSRY